MISQLRLSGVLKRQQLVLVGDFTGSDRNAGIGAGRYTLQDAMAECGLPVVFGLPYGHIASTMSLPFGVSARVVMQDETLVIRADNCPVPTEFPGAQQANAPLWWV